MLPRAGTLSAAAGTAAAAATGGGRRLNRACAASATQRNGREQLHGVGVALRALCRIAGGGHRPVDLEGVATGATAELVARHVSPSGGGAAHRPEGASPRCNYFVSPQGSDLGGILAKTDPVRSSLLRKPVAWIVVAVLLSGAAFALYWFQPWRLLTSKTVNEVLPTVQPAQPPAGEGATATASPSESEPPGNVLLASGEIISHEHESSGRANLIRLADGRIQVTFENLDTSDGPDLHVWLTDAPVIEGRAGWHVFDDGRYVELGPLKGNRGNQVYDVPAGTDLDGLTSVTIWCKRFAVSFGAARLDRV